jgi:hypothetical protein
MHAKYGMNEQIIESANFCLPPKFFSPVPPLVKA